MVRRVTFRDEWYEPVNYFYFAIFCGTLSQIYIHDEVLILYPEYHCSPKKVYGMIFSSIVKYFSVTKGESVLTKPLLKKYLEIQNYLSKYALRIPEPSRAVLIVSGKQA